MQMHVPFARLYE